MSIDQQGVMHTCGRDRHRATLLGAARALAPPRASDGTAMVTFQPAEEGGGAGKAMIDDGLMDRLEIDELLAMRTEPGLSIGSFSTASDRLAVLVRG